VAGRAGRLIRDDVRIVKPETGVAQHHRAAVAFVAQHVGGGAFGLIIGQRQVAFEDGPVNGAVRSVGTGGAGIGRSVRIQVKNRKC
jgi:hypothetical protein